MLPKLLIVETAYENYLTVNKENDVQIKFLEVDIIEKPKGTLIYNKVYYIYRDDDKYCVYYKDSNKKDYHALLVQDDKKSDRYICFVMKKEWWRFEYTSQVFEIIGIEYILNRNKIMLLHASHIKWKNQSILFTAPSGTGKSTQADLWEKYEQAEIINGDRAALRKQENHYYAYGLPYAGSSNIFTNDKGIIAAIIVLRQDKQNSIIKLNESDAFRYLYSEMTVQYWDKKYQDILIQELIALIKEVPIYLLKCRPDRESVKMVKQIITERKDV